MLRHAGKLAGLKALLPALILAALASVLSGGCASTPEAQPQRDVDAKEFQTHPNAAAIYVYRVYFNRGDEDSVLYLDNRLIGSTLPAAYYRIDAVPGRHVLHGLGFDSGQLVVDARPGQLYFVRLDVIGGRSHFRLEPEQVGRAEVRACCAMLESWAPGQRPLLR